MQNAGDTALMLVLRQGNLEVVDLLLSFGADTSRVRGPPRCWLLFFVCVVHVAIGVCVDVLRSSP